MFKKILLLAALFTTPAIVFTEQSAKALTTYQLQSNIGPLAPNVPNAQSGTGTFIGNGPFNGAFTFDGNTVTNWDFGVTGTASIAPTTFNLLATTDVFYNGNILIFCGPNNPPGTVACDAGLAANFNANNPFGGSASTTDYAYPFLVFYLAQPLTENPGGFIDLNSSYIGNLRYYNPLNNLNGQGNQVSKAIYDSQPGFTVTPIPFNLSLASLLPLALISRARRRYAK